jgi:hypothetical protein
MRGKFRKSDGYVRAANYMELAIRRRSLAPVLLVQCQEKKRFISFSSRVSV